MNNKMIINCDYYSDNSRISNSALGSFLKYGPLALKDIIEDNNEQLNLPQLEIGTMIHEYILQPEEFW